MIFSVHVEIPASSRLRKEDEEVCGPASASVLGPGTAADATAARRTGVLHPAARHGGGPAADAAA